MKMRNKFKEKNKWAFKKGQIPWNKGLTKKDERVKNNSEKAHKTMREKSLYGHNKGIKSRKKSEAKLGNKNPAWNGGRQIKVGYIQIYLPVHPYANSRGYIFEHRIIVEKKIGRYLNPEEVIHHIDGNRQNNHIENLILFPNSREHIKFHIKIKQFGLTTPILRQIEERWR